MSETKEEKVDYLDVDDTIPGQNYVCLSFVSPEALIEKREAFNVCKFLQSYCKEQELDYKELKDNNINNYNSYVSNLLNLIITYNYFRL